MAFLPPHIWTRTESLDKMKTVIGTYLLTLFIGLQWNWGNLAPYVSSYVLKHQPDIDTSPSPWLLSLFLVAMNISFLASSWLSKYTGKRLATLLGIVAFNIGMLSSYFVIQLCPLLLNITLGVVVGVGSGILANMGMIYTLSWAANDLGFLTSLYLSAVNIGSIAINEMMTFYINPNNEKADLIKGDFVYFSNTNIVDKVPDIFLCIGFISLAVQLLGLLLVRSKDNNISEPLNSYHGDKVNELKTVTFEKRSKTYCHGNEGLSTYSDDPCEHEPLKNGSVHWNCCCIPHEGNRKKSGESNLNLLRIILQSKTFCLLCVCFILIEYPYILLANYYKAFGILEISDDHFLAEIGSLMILVSAISRVIYGRLMDKFGVKDNMICISALLGVGCTFYFFSVRISKWLYAAMTICLASISCAQYNSFIVATVTIFGIDNASFNVGMLLTAGIVLNVTAPVGIEYILRFLGWFSLFAGGSILSFIEMILIIIFLPKI